MKLVSAFSLFLILILGCSETKEKNVPGICISFDDRYVEEWYDLRPMFEKYDARVTFFITQFDSLTTTEVNMLQKLQSDGHEIGNHGALHVLSEYYIKDNSYDTYLENEIIANKDALNHYSFDATSFAYPYGAKHWFTDFLISSHHSALRSDVPVNKEKDLTLMDEIYFDFDGSNEFYSVGFDYNYELTETMIANALTRAKLNNEVLCLHGHGPAEQGDYHFSIETLEFILKEARRLKLEFFTYSELISE
ncbi:MAG: polysaccharide deacetylase family protein [Fulvivirga sp.]|uniref:polysaccharide deacetylase family protein n=1 Tax=Fulvivirga sp. TaxID=1931237 RepID=UPI0032EC31D4